MIYDAILNAMDADELRNYVHMQTEFEHCYNDLLYNMTGVADALHQAYNAKCYEAEKRLRYELMRRDKQMLEKRIYEKYEHVLPKPACDTPAPVDCAWEKPCE